MIEICKKCPKQLEFFYNRPAADTKIVNCQLSIVNSAKPLNSSLSLPAHRVGGLGKYPIDKEMPLGYTVNAFI